MKRLFFCLMALVLVSCQQIKYRDIVGMWMLDQIDGKPVPTKEVFVCDYQMPTTQTLASGFLFSDNDRRWVERDTYRFSIRYNKITINGKDALGDDIKIVLTDNVFTDSTWAYTLTTNRVNSVQIDDNSRFLCRRLGDRSYTQSIIGNWVVTETNGIPSNLSCCQMNPNGTFFYYRYDTISKQWNLKEDNDGKYKLYGDLLAMNYANSLVQPRRSGNYYDCWEILKMENDTMLWYAYDKTGEVYLTLKKMSLTDSLAVE